MRKILSKLVWVAVFIGIFIVFTNGITDADFWWHLKTGELILETRSIPRTDIFSHTAAGRPWTAHEWPAQVIFFLVYRYLGLSGVVYFTAALATLSFILLALIAKKEDIPPALSQLALVLGAVAVAPFMIPRPQMFYFVLWSLLIVLLHRYILGERRVIYAIPLLFFFWANLHASMYLMVLLIAVFLGAEAVIVTGKQQSVLAKHRGILIATVIGSLVALVNVNTTIVYTFIAKVIPVQKTLSVSEWGSFLREYRAWQAWVLIAFYLLVLLTFLMSVKRKARAGPMKQGMIVFTFILFSLVSSKFVPLAVLLAVPLVAQNLRGLLRFHSGRILPVGVVLMLLLSLGYHRYLGRPLNAHEDAFPWKAARFVSDSRPEGSMYNTYNFGGFLIWSLYPQYRVFIDGRYEMFEPDAAAAFHAMLNGAPEWESGLQKYGVSFLVLPPVEVHSALAQSTDWVLVYFDNHAAVFVKDDGRNRRLIDAFGYRVIHPFSGEPRYGSQEQEAAISEYRRSLENDPDIFRSHYDLGMIYLGRQEYGQSEAHLREAVRVFPSSVNSRLNLAVALEKQGKVEASQLEYGQAQELR